MSDDAAEFEYPAGWTPKGVEPPVRHWTKPHLVSGLGHTGDEQPEDPDAYPEAWRP